MLRRYFGTFQKPRTFDVKSTGFLKKPKISTSLFWGFSKTRYFCCRNLGFLHVSKSWGISQEITVRIVTLYDELNIVGQAFSVDASCGCPKYTNSVDASCGSPKYAN